MIQQPSYRNRAVAAKILFALFFAVSIVSAQTAQTALVRVNKFWGSVNSRGLNTAATFQATDLNTFADQGAIGMRLMGNESHFSGYITLACTNWKDATAGTVIPKAIFPVVNKYQTSGLDVVTAMTNYLRYASPVDSVYYQSSKLKLPSPNFGTPSAVDPTKCVGTSDQTVTVTNKFVNGVTVTRRVLAWGQKLHDNYVVSDLTFNNTSKDTLHNFYIFFQEGNYYAASGDGTNPAVAAVDNFFDNSVGPRRWYHYYGSRTTDSLRVFYQYIADDPEKAGDNMGQPLTEQQGRLFNKDFYFAATLHASQKPYTPAGTSFPSVDANDVDDMNQPKVTTYANLQTALNLTLFSSTSPLNDASYYNMISGETLASDDMIGADVRPGHHRKNQDELGKAFPGGEPGMDPKSNSFGSMVYCYGPYEFAPGKQIRIVKASGIAGISREQAVEVGKKWKNKTLADPTGLPNATTGFFPSNFVFPSDATENDKKKDRWISLGIKELHATVSRAKNNFKSNYNVSVTPAPPSRTVVKPATGGINISWLPSSSESASGFVGYRLLKKMSSYDTVYYKVVYQGKGNSFFDTNVRPSPKYFYYIQAGVKYNADTVWSNRFWKYNTDGTSASTAPSSDGLEKIVIAPNPFNYRDPMLAKYLFETPKNLTITFFKLPKEVTISIYTEYGDLVRSVQNSGTGDYKMKMVNEKGQAIASGVYIVVFQTPDGGFSYQKLVVAR